MKKLVALALAVGMLPSALLAAGKHPMAGCGLAYMLFAKDNNSKGIQILASTTNNLYGTQTFGITSGTSGCTEDGMLSKNVEAEVYADVNFRNLSQEMAAGGGEYLNTFASLLGVSSSQRTAFGRFVQERYTKLFPSADTTASQMLETLTQELSAHPELLG